MLRGIAATVTAFARGPHAFFQRRSERLDDVFRVGLAAALSLPQIVVLGGALWLFSRQFTGAVTVDDPSFDRWTRDGTL